jgi:SAM-dependent methyltransferase
LYFWKEYWAALAKSHGAADRGGLAAVLHPEAPEWYNATIDKLQEDAWREGMRACHVGAGTRVLDVGCGTGRWLRRYLLKGAHPVGLDATQGMLQRAFEVDCPLVVAPAQSLPFRADTFEVVSAITVIQHIPLSEHRIALMEMARVLKPGGYVLLIDLIRGIGPHIFSRPADDWIDEARDCGLSLVCWRGQEYLFLDRGFVWIVQSLRRRSGHGSDSGPPIRVGRAPRGKALYWSVRRATCALSAWLEPLVEEICPNRFATHGLFVFRKI